MEENRFNQVPVQNLAQSRQESFDVNSTAFLAQEIQNKTINNIKLNNNIDSMIKGDMFSSGKEGKISMVDEVAFDDVYAKAGGGFVSRYPNYLKGVDNNERAARLQTTGEKWANGLSKAGINLFTAAVGGTIGTVTGLINTISSGFSEKVYDDDFNNWLDGLNEVARYKLPNFYSKQEQQMSFGQSLGTANFWAADLPHGISFTLGAIVSEGIWAGLTGGSSLATAAARWSLRASKIGKLVKGVNDYNKLVKPFIRQASIKDAAAQATKMGKVADLLNTARFTYTSAGYEAGVEARHFMKESEENFINYYKTNYGRLPNAQEMADFQKDLSTASNALYAGNLAVVGGSNLAVFGRMFDVTKPLLKSGKTLRDGIDRRLFGLGTKQSTVGTKVVRDNITPSALQKIAGRTRDFAKAPLVEGFWEEGNQNVMGNLGTDWVTQGYDITSTRDNYSMIGGLYDAYAQTYGSKEGWKEIGIGMMVGMLGGGVSGQWNRYGKQLKEQETISAITKGEMGADAIVQTLKEGSVAPMMFADKLAAQNRIVAANTQEQEAQSRGDILGQELARHKAFLASIEVNKKYDRLDEAYEDLKTSLELADSEQWAKQAGVDVETINQYKQDVLSEYQQLQEEYSANKDFADLIVGTKATTKDLKGKDLVAQAIAYNMTMGTKSMEAAQVFLEEINIEMAKFVSPEKASDIKNALDARKVLQTASEVNREEFFKLKKRRSEITQEKEQLEKTILETQRKLQRLNTPEGKQEEQSKLLEYSGKLNDLNTLEVQLENQYLLAYQTLQAESPFTQNVIDGSEFLTASQLDKVLEIDNKGKVVGGTLAEIDNLIKAQEQVNPKRAAQLKKMFDEYRKSVYALKEYNKTIQGIANENFSPAEFVTKLEQTIAGITKKEANQFTKDFFADVANKMNEDTAELMESSKQTSTEPTPTRKVREGDFGKIVELVKGKKERAGLSEEDLRLMKEYPRLINEVKVLEQKRKKEKDGILKNVRQEGFILTTPTVKSFVQERIKEIDQRYDSRLDKLFDKKTKEQETEIDRLNNIIEETTKDSNTISTYVGENQSEAKKNRPTTKNIEDLKALQEKLVGTRFFGNTILLENSPKVLKEELGEEVPLTEKEIEDLQRLNSKLTNWQVMEGTMVQGINATLADLITRVAQLETTIEKNIKQKLEKIDAIQIHEASEKNASASRNDIRTVQTLNGVYLKFESADRMFLSHVNVTTLLGKYFKGEITSLQIKKPSSKKFIDIDATEIDKYQRQEGTLFVVNKDIQFTIGERGRINFETKIWNELKNSLSLQFLSAKDIDPQAKNNSFILGYEILEDGNSVLAKSDFTVESGFVQMTAEEMRAADKLFLYVDPKDSYNKKLLADYNKAVKSKNKTKIETALKVLEENVGISLMYGEKFAGFLRSGLHNNGTGNNATMFAQIRKNATQKFIDNQGNNLINLETTIAVNFKYSGSPIFSLQRTEDGVTIKENVIGARELKIIKDAGFVENGNITIGKLDTEKVNKVYLPKNSQKTPIIVFEYAGEMIAFPVSLNTSVQDRSAQILDILDNQNLTDGQKVNEINSLLIRNQLEPKNFNLKESSLTAQGLKEVVTALENVEIVPNINNWATKAFNLNDLSLQATIAIDLANNPFNTPKMVLDVANAQVAQPEEFREQVEDSSLAILDKVQNYVAEILSKQSQYIRQDGSAVEDTVFTDVLDNDVLERDASSYVEKRANLKKLEKALSKPVPPTITKVHGKEFFDNLKKDLNKFRQLESKRTALTKQIKEKVKQKKNQDC